MKTVPVSGLERSCFIMIPGRETSGFIMNPVLVPGSERSGFIMNPVQVPGRERSGFIMNPVPVLVQDYHVDGNYPAAGQLPDN